MSPIKRALISVSDKTNIVSFANALHAQKVEIISTGGTAKLLADNNIPVIEISDYTGFAEMMDGRVKTLHPKVHGGILGRRGTDEAVMEKHGIKAIDLVVVNLYPFAETIKSHDCPLETAIENIDIGGPTLIRAAAKNHTSVTVVVSSEDYQRVLSDMHTHANAITAELRADLAVKAFEHTAQYDAQIANYLGSTLLDDGKPFPRCYFPQFHKVQVMRYGENPHQAAAFYRDAEAVDASVANSQQLQGKALSFNNIADTDAALECVKQFNETACVIVKHANPCGVAIGSNVSEAYSRAYKTDPTSAFGGIIAFNRALDSETAQRIIEQQFVEVIIAPEISEQCLSVLASKPNVRVLCCGHLDTANQSTWDFKRVNGGLLVQDRDMASIQASEIKVVSRRAPSQEELYDLMFCWKVAKFVKSNAIVYAKQGMTIGVGAGQMSRVYSARIAAIKAQDADLQVAGSVMASDAFFPFRDGLDSAAEVGVTAVIQPGGSIRDEEVINAANEHGIAMVFTGIRHFRH